MGLTNDERYSLVELRLDKARRFIKGSRTNAFFKLVGLSS